MNPAAEAARRLEAMDDRVMESPSPAVPSEEAPKVKVPGPSPKENAPGRYHQALLSVPSRKGECLKA